MLECDDDDFHRGGGGPRRFTLLNISHTHTQHFIVIIIISITDSCTIILEAIMVISFIAIYLYPGGLVGPYTWFQIDWHWKSKLKAQSFFSLQYTFLREIWFEFERNQLDDFEDSLQKELTAESVVNDKQYIISNYKLYKHV